MGARQSTSVSKKLSGPSRRKRSAPSSRTRNGRLPVVSTSSDTYSAPSSGVSGVTSAESTATSCHGTGDCAPRGLSRTGFGSFIGGPREIADFVGSFSVGVLVSEHPHEGYQDDF